MEEKIETLYYLEPTPEQHRCMEKCIICDKWDGRRPLVVKIPEFVSFCLDCCDKHADDTVYDLKEWWWGIYRPWEWFLDPDGNVCGPDFISHIPEDEAR